MTSLTPEMITLGAAGAFIIVALLLLKLFPGGSWPRYLIAFTILGAIVATAYLLLSPRLEMAAKKAEYRKEAPTSAPAPSTTPPADDAPDASKPEPPSGFEIGRSSPPPSGGGMGAPPPQPEDGLTPGAGETEDEAPPPPSPRPPSAAPPPPPPPVASPGPEPDLLERAPDPSGSGAPPPPGPSAPTTADTPEADKTDWDVVPVFYGTDRAETPNPKRLTFGSERGRKLDLGRALVTVPKTHIVPNIERPWVLKIPYFQVTIYEEKEDPKKHFTVQEINRLTREQFLDLVKVRLAGSARFKDHAFIFIHGFNTSFDNAIYRTAQIANDIKFDGAPFLYSWPSGGNVGSYTYDFGSAEQAEPYLKEFIELVLKETGAKSISLIAHSMGNQVLLRVLENLKPTLPPEVRISQVILAAPDVDRDKFDNLARFIKGMASGVTLYAAANDYALGWARRFHGGVPRAGDVPATGPLIIDGIDTIDVTAASTDSLGLNHSGYAENNKLLDDIGALLLSGLRPPNKRLPILESITTERGEYWKYPVIVQPN